MIPNALATFYPVTLLGVCLVVLFVWSVDVKPQLDASLSKNRHRLGRNTQSVVPLAHEQPAEKIHVIYLYEVLPHDNVRRNLTENLSNLAIEVFGLTVRCTKPS